MKVFLSLVVSILLTCTFVYADWPQAFKTTFDKKGIDTAVTEALSEGIDPVQIIKYGITIEGLAQPELIKALFCALVQPATINDAAEANNLPESTVSEGYQLALAQCAKEMEEQENIAPGTAFPGVSPTGQKGPAQASPWKFN